MSEPLISIVIVNYNTCALLAACLRSLIQFAPNTQAIVVDNASADGSVAMVRDQFPSVHLIVDPSNLGFARAMNLGVRATTAPLVLALNADVELFPSTLASLVATAERLPRAGILGPAQYSANPANPKQLGTQIASAFPDPILAREIVRLVLFGDSIAARLHRGPWQKISVGPPRSVDWLMGAALLFRRECWTDLNGFDETQFMYGEDWDICYRARQAGWQVYLVPEAKIIHHENAAGAQFFASKRQARVLEANLYFHEKHFGRTSRRMLAASNLIGAGLRLALSSPGQMQSPQNSKQIMRWESQIEKARAAWRGCLN